MSKFVVFALIALLIVLLSSTVGAPAHGQVIIIGTSIVPDFQTVTPVLSAPTPVDCPPTSEPAEPEPTPTAAPPAPTPTSEPDRPTPAPAEPTRTAAPPTATPTRTAAPTATATTTPPEPTPTVTPPATRLAAASPTATQPAFTVTATPVRSLALLAETLAPPATPAAPVAPEPAPAPLLPVLPQVSLSVLPALLALLGAGIFLAAERIRSALLAQTRQQRLIALEELALRRAVQQQTFSYPTPAAALSALRQIIYDATGADCGELAVVGLSGLLVVRDLLLQHYAFTPHGEQAQALARRYHGRIWELSSAGAGLLAADELMAAQRTLLSAASLTPRGALIWHLVRYDPRPQYRLHRPRGLRLGRQHGGDLVS